MYFKRTTWILILGALLVAMSPFAHTVSVAKDSKCWCQSHAELKKYPPFSWCVDRSCCWKETVPVKLLTLGLEVCHMNSLFTTIAWYNYGRPLYGNLIPSWSAIWDKPIPGNDYFGLGQVVADSAFFLLPFVLLFIVPAIVFYCLCLKSLVVGLSGLARKIYSMCISAKKEKK